MRINCGGSAVTVDVCPVIMSQEALQTALRHRILSRCTHGSTIAYATPPPATETNRVPARVALEQAAGLGLNLPAVGGLEWWRYAMGVELEHGTLLLGENGLTNVTGDSWRQTARIALAHVLEFPDYYQRLARMEQEADVYWSKQATRPSVILEQ